MWGPGLPLAGLGAGLYVAGSAWLPRAGLAGVVATLSFYLFPRQLGGLAISPPEATLLLCALGVALRGVRSRIIVGPLAPHAVSGVGEQRGSTRPPTPDPYAGPIALFLGAALLSLLVTEYLRLSLRELRTLIVEPVLLFYLARHVLRTAEDAVGILDVLLAAATVVALIGIGQFFLGGAVTDVQGVRRVHGTYASPNHLGLLLGRTIPILLAFGWVLPNRAPRLAALAACLAALGLTFSLGAWLGTGAAVLVLAALLGGRRAVAIVAATGAGLALVALPLLRVERVVTHLDPGGGTTFARLQLWRASLQMLAEQPLLGIGLDNFLYRYPAYVPSGVMMEPNLSHPHNLVLQFWLQLGLGGLVALVWLLGSFVGRAWPGVATGQPPMVRACAAGILASMTDFVVHGLIDNSYFLVDTAFIFWLTLALSCQPLAVSCQPLAVGRTDGEAPEPFGDAEPANS